MRKKFLAGLLALVMLLSLVPVTAFAAEGEARTGVTGGTTNSNGMMLTKTAQLQFDGTYTINLEAFATGTTTTTQVTKQRPLDIVLVLDQSGSMASSGYVDDLKSAVTDFVNTISEDAAVNNVNHRIAMVGFGSEAGEGAAGDSGRSVSAGSNNTYWINTGLFVDGYLKNYAETASTTSTLTAEQYQKALASVNDADGTVNDTITLAISHIASMGRTRTSYGMIMASQVFAHNPLGSNEEGRKRIVVLFTDGKPGNTDFEEDDANAAIEAAYTVKNTYDATVYTVGLYSNAGDQVDDFMNLVSSNYPTGEKMADLDGTETYTAVYSSLMDNNSVYYVRNYGNYYPVQYGLISSETTYTAITGTPDTSKTYYVRVSYGMGATYVSVTYSNGRWIRNNLFGGGTTEVNPSSTTFYEATTTSNYGWYYQNGSRKTQYTPKATASDTSNTQFYKRVVEGALSPSAAKYYMTTSDSSELGKIFETISQDAIESGTTVTLTEEAVMRDIMTPGAFQLPAGFTAASNITVKTRVVTTTDDKTYSYGDVTTYTANGDGIFTSGDKTITVTANTETDTVDVTGFDYAENFVSTGHPGNKLIITIKGVEATEDAATGETVYTNSNMSGIYEDGEKVTPIVAFPTPDTIIPNKSYVIDYAKPFDINASTDWGSTGVTHLASSMAKFDKDNPASTLDLTNGKVSASGTTLTYTPQTMNWKGYDKFFSFGTQQGGTTEKPIYQWSKVNVIPANNVYYEDDFVTTEKTNADGSVAKDEDGNTVYDTVGIEYGEGWSIEYGTAGSDAAGSTDGNGEVADNTVHGGWVSENDDLSDDTTFSDNAAHVAGAGATATFTFTGTGVDIYSYTDIKSGMVVGMLYEGTDTTATMKQLLMIDNFAQSGNYYQIPTLSFQGLKHGTYTVKLVVNKLKVQNADGTIATDKTGETIYRDTYYLDGIRIYNPIQNIESTDDTVQDAYTEKDETGNIGSTELNAVFTEVRDILIDANSYDSEGENTGAVFVDQTVYNEDTDTTVAKIGVYKDYGPKNEVYLAKGQHITFKVDSTDAMYQIGLKAPEGTTNATWSNGDSNFTQDLAHASDLYYKTTPANGGYITVTNNGDNLLSVTKIKTTGATAESAGLMLLAMTEEEAVAEVSAFSLRTVMTYNAAPEEEVPESPVEPDVPKEPEIPEEPTEPETPEVPDIDIEIENPEPKPEKTPVRPILHHNLKKLVNNLFNQIHGWFGR